MNTRSKSGANLGMIIALHFAELFGRGVLWLFRKLHYPRRL